MPLSESTIARRGPVGEALLDGGPDRGALAAGRRGRRGCAPRPSLGLRAGGASCSPYCCEDVGKNARTTWPKMIGSETFIIVALRWTENSTSSALARAICSARNASQRGDAHDGGVDDLAGEDRQADSLSTVTVPSSATCSMRRVSSAVDDDRLLVGAEVVLAHGGDVGLRVGRPGAHRVRVLAGVLLHRRGRAAVGVALAQDRVDRAALDLVVAGADVLLLVGLRARRGSRAGRSPCACSSATAALSCGTEAEMLGSLMMLASGVVASCAELGRGRRRRAAPRAAGRRTRR